MRILAPIDQSPRDGIVLPYCARLATAVGGTVCVVYVINPARGLLPGAARHGEAYVHAVERGLQEQGANTEGIVRHGDPAATIVRLAAELRADAIVMVTRGRRGVDKFMLGSVTDAVLANCHTPVILLSATNKETLSDEELRRESAYLAAVVRYKETTGAYTPDEAERQLDRLANAGLDRGVLFSNYQAQEEQGVFFDWLDLGFQLRALRRYFPEDVEALELEDLPGAARAA